MKTEKVTVNHVDIKWPKFRYTASALNRAKITMCHYIFCAFYPFAIYLALLVALRYAIYIGLIRHIGSFYLDYSNFIMIFESDFYLMLKLFTVSEVMCFVSIHWCYEPITYSFEFRRDKLIYTKKDIRDKVSDYYFYLSDCKLLKCPFSVKLIVHKGFLRYHIIKISKRHVDDVTRLKIYKFLSQGI